MLLHKTVVCSILFVVIYHFNTCLSLSTLCVYLFLPLKNSSCASLNTFYICILCIYLLFMYKILLSNLLCFLSLIFVLVWSSCQLINKIIVCSLREMFEFNGKSEKKPDREKKKKFPVNCIVPALCTCRDQSFVGFSSCPNKFCCPTKFQCMFFCVRFRRKHNFVSERFFSLYKF